MTYSSVGRTPRLHRGGLRFESGYVNSLSQHGGSMIIFHLKRIEILEQDYKEFIIIAASHIKAMAIAQTKSYTPVTNKTFTCESLGKAHRTYIPGIIIANYDYTDYG